MPYTDSKKSYERKETGSICVVLCTGYKGSVAGLPLQVPTEEGGGDGREGRGAVAVTFEGTLDPNYLNYPQYYEYHQYLQPCSWSGEYLLA